MIQRKKKQIKIVLLIILIVVALGVGMWGICTAINKNNKNSSSIQEDLSEFELKSLIITTKISEKDLKEKYKAAEVNSLTFGATETETYEIKYNTAKETKDAYEKLKDNNQVVEIEINKKRSINKIKNEILYFNINGLEKEITNWGTIAMGLDTATETASKNTDNEEIIVAIIDSGLDVDHEIFNQESNKELKNRILEGYNAIDNSNNVTDNDEYGHGTNVAGIILEATPNNVKILPIKALDIDENGETTGTDASIIRAINYAVSNNADIINMSLGGSEEGTSSSGQTYIDNAYNKGITCIVAAGNGNDYGIAIDMDKQGENWYPAECEHVITVGAVKNKLLIANSKEDFVNSYDTYIKATVEDMEITKFSNYGEALDFVGPGESILGLSAQTSGGKMGTAVLTGTSQATPHIAAAAAIVKSYNKNYTSDQVEEVLKYYSQDMGDEGKDVYYGNGFVSFKELEECECNSEKCDKIYCFGCENTRCIYHQGSTNRLTSIEITEEPTKTEYQAGETFDRAGMVVTANYSDGSSKTITEYTWEPEGELKKENTSIVISYTENNITKTIEQEIQVESGVITEELTSIEITTPPTKVDYEEGETFDKTGMVITAKYEDNSSEIITDYTYSPREALKISDTKVIITYTQGDITKTVEQIINVTEKGDATLTKIEITTPPAKTIYEEGETFDKAGMVVTATYNDGTEKLVNNYNIEPIRKLTIDDTEITITYTEAEIEKTAKQEITVKQANTSTSLGQNSEKELSKISASSKPSKISYEAGEKFNPSGMVIIATYLDGTSKTITDYTYEPSGKLDESDKKITISYKDKTIDIPITVQTANTENYTNLVNVGSSTPGLNSNMFQYENGEEQTSDETTDKRDEIASTNNQQNNNNNKKDETTTQEKLSNAGLENSAITMGIGITIIIMAISYISYRKYKEI